MHLPSLLSHFPPVTYGFAYGSGVFQQAGLYDTQQAGARGVGPMLDMIVVVDDPVQWHAQNIARNRRHYSFMAALGSRTVACVAERIGAGTYFNTLVPLGQQYIKYGVIGAATFSEDLHSWRHLYVAGRLQKPVRHLVPPPPHLQPALQSNVRHALGTALLLSPETTTLEALFARVAALSYTGDVRMGVAEDAKKVQRIVAGSYTQLVDLYAPVLQDQAFAAAGVEHDAQRATVRQDMRPEARLHLLSQLPWALLALVARRAGVALPAAAGAAPNVQSAREEAARAVLRGGHPQRLITRGLRSLVFASSA